MTYDKMTDVERACEKLRLEMLQQPRTEENDTYSDGYARGLLRALQALDAALQSATPVEDEEETYLIGKRDGYSEAMQEIDLLTGGDGEYRYCTNHDPERHCPDPEAMKRRIIERLSSTGGQGND